MKDDNSGWARCQWVYPDAIVCGNAAESHIAKMRSDESMKLCTEHGIEYLTLAYMN